MTYWFVLGTAAELIKIYPLIDEASKRKINWSIIQTGQSVENFSKQLRDFQISNDNIFNLSKNSSDLKTSVQALCWFIKTIIFDFRRIKLKLKNKIAKDDYIFVHGDTLSTLLGGVLGRILGLKIIHIEAGMRSHNWRSPFPEELTRRMVSKLAHYHMTPDENAKKNLANEGITENVFLTNGNTIVDSLQLFSNKIEKGNYIVANVHRFENLMSNDNWTKIISLICETAKNYKVKFVLMPNTIEKLKSDKNSKEKLVNAGVELIPRLPFKEFVHLMEGSLFVLSDGGSNQQECHYLGKPCLILRKVTESIEGIDGSCVLSKLDDKIITNFLKEYESFKRPSQFPSPRPTDIIFKNI